MQEPAKFIKEAQQGIVTVEFTKINTGDTRVMPCTLAPSLIPNNIEIREIDPNSDHLVVWSLDKDAWRSFRVNTVTSWYKGKPGESTEEISNQGSDS